MTPNNLELMRTLDDSWNAQDWGLRLGLTSDMRLYDNCTMTLGIVDFWVLSVFYNL